MLCSLKSCLPLQESHGAGISVAGISRLGAGGCARSNGAQTSRTDERALGSITELLRGGIGRSRLRRLGADSRSELKVKTVKLAAKLARIRSNSDAEKENDKDKPITPEAAVAASSRDELLADAGARPEPINIHPRKRKIKATSEKSKYEPLEKIKAVSMLHPNVYKLYLHIRRTIEVRQKSLMPVRPKPPKDFNNYLMNRRTYTLQSTINRDSKIEVPSTLPPPMIDEFAIQAKQRIHLVTQHLVEKEKLVLAVEQEILRVHGRAERAMCNQTMPYSVCSILRGREIYTEIPPEQEDNRPTRRGRCNGRQINAWLQEVDDKWEKIKEGVLRRQHIEAETLHAVQKMEWGWKLQEVGLCDYKTKPIVAAEHVPQIEVSNFDLPA